MEGWGEEGKKLKNTLPLYGNKDSMNLNSMILSNIVGSPYFREELIQYKTFHEVVDEIYYKVEHMEPWEKNSRKLAGQVGMCAGVRGVAAGGIVSSAFCLLYKMFTLKLTRKQVNVMLNHGDSPYIRGVGFLYVRYCQPPADFWDWFSPYLEDEEEINLKAGGSYTVTVGEMCRMMLTNLDWFGTLFPRMPVTVQKDVNEKLKEVPQPARVRRDPPKEEAEQKNGTDKSDDRWGEAARFMRENRDSRSPRRSRRERSTSRDRERRRNRSTSRGRHRSRSRDRRDRHHSRERRRGRSSSRERHRSRSRDRRTKRSSSRDRARRSNSRERPKRRSRERRRSRSHSRDRKYR